MAKSTLLSPELRALVKRHPLPKRLEADRVQRGDLEFARERYQASARETPDHWQVFLAIEAELGRDLGASVDGLALDAKSGFARWCFGTGRADLGLRAFESFAKDPASRLEEADVLEYLGEVESAQGTRAMLDAADALFPRFRSDRVAMRCAQAASTLGDLEGAQGRLAREGADSTLAAGALRVEQLELLAPKAPAAPRPAPPAPQPPPPPASPTTPPRPAPAAPAPQRLVPTPPPPPPAEPEAYDGDETIAIPPSQAPVLPVAPPPPAAPSAAPGAAAPTAIRPPVVGQLVGGKYQIDAFITEGRLAQVFSALREGTPRHVALKVMLPAFASDPRVSGRFGAAAKAAEGLLHPHIVPVFGSGEDRGWLFLAAEHVFGEDLDSFVAGRGVLPPPLALRFARDMCGALRYAAARGIVHGGLRPSNVFFARQIDAPENELVRLADFGMSGVDPSSTPIDPYTAPELLAGQSASPASDVYGLGALLFTLLAGEAPFREVAPERLERAILHNPPAPPRNAAGLHPHVLSLLVRCLRKSPAERPANVEQLDGELETALRAQQAAAIQVPGIGPDTAVGSETTTRSFAVDPRTGEPAPDLVGRELDGRFRVVSFMRSGGMAQLYYGTQAVEPRRVAIKVMHPRFAQSPEIVRRFAREAELAAQLDHPNIVRLVHVGQDPRLLYIVMELLDGEDLSVRIRQRGPVAESQAAAIGVAVSRALAYAHALGVVHRDIKPANVMFSPTMLGEQIKLLDFGIAKVLDRAPVAGGLEAPQSALTNVGDLVGTPRYMSPEQGRAEDVDHRADLYSLGVVLYELVTGVVPFDGETPLQIVARHVQDEPKPPSLLVPELNGSLERLILSLLRKAPAARPSSAAEVASRLAELLPQLASSPATSRSRWLEARTATPRSSSSLRRPGGPPPSAPSTVRPAEDDEIPTRAKESELKPLATQERTVAMAAISPHGLTPPPHPVQAPAAISPAAISLPDPGPVEGARPVPRTLMAATRTEKMDRAELLREAARLVPLGGAGAHEPVAEERPRHPPVPQAELSGVEPTVTSAVPIARLRAQGPLSHVPPPAAANDAERRSLETQIARLYRVVLVLIGLVALLAIVVVLVLLR